MKTMASTLVLATIVAGLLLATNARAEEKSPSAKVDELLIAAQQICPVSSEELGAMGTPIKTKVGEQTVFLCCKGCVGKSIPKENWKKVTANLIAAQGKCPVKDEELAESAPSIIVKHRRIFTCCKSCLSKVKDDPEKYIAVVNKLLEEHLKESQHQG